MAACLQTGDLFALVGGRHLKLAHGGVAALGQRGHIGDLPTLDGGQTLGKQPGIAEHTAADHSHVGTGVLQNAGGILGLEDVAVGDNGDAHRLFHLTDPVPVGLTGVHLGLGAAVDRHGGHTGLLHGLCKLHTVDGALVPAQTELHRHRAARSPDHGLGHLHRQIGSAHQAGAVAGVGHLGHGTTHVDINKIAARLLVGNACGLLHAIGIAAEDLGGGGVFPLPQFQQGHSLFILIAQGLGADHFGAGQSGPLLSADGAKGDIRHTRHRAEGQGGGDLNSSDTNHNYLQKGKNTPQIPAYFTTPVHS